MKMLLIWLLLAALFSAPVGAAPASLDQVSKALAEYRVKEAIQLLTKAKSEGPYKYKDHVRLYEQLGIAYAYTDKKEQALAAFDMLLALDPGHALSYTLSPKVTFLFEQARKSARSHQPPTVDLSWPRNLKVSDPVPVDVEVIADPKDFMKWGNLQARRRGTIEYKTTYFKIPPQGQYHRIELPPTHPDATEGQVLQIYMSIHDQRGNQVLMLGDANRPREIPLKYVKPEPWYNKWWIWAIVGSVVAAGTGTAVYFLLYQPPNDVGGSFRTH
jgi:tetratricopeptide (TPR) repeat protein